MSNSADLAAQARVWAGDAQTTFTNWPGLTAAQKDATTREVIRRLGVLMSNVAEHLDNYAMFNA